MKSELKRNLMTFVLAAFLLAAVLNLWAANPDEKKVFSSLPIKEITVFKDGHAFVLHEGKMPTDKNGNVCLDYLPNPVIGTFWAYSADAKVKLSSVVSAKIIISLENTALRTYPNNS